MATNEDLMHAIQSLDAKFESHVADEKPILAEAKTLIDLHGDSEAIRARVSFINIWMERAKDRAELRRAIIKHGTLLAMTAVVLFIFRAVWRDILDLIWMQKK